MPTALATDPALSRFRQALHEMYGNRLARAVLFGSRARGDARPDSDYDVAVFLKSPPDRWVELDRLARLRVRVPLLLWRRNLARGVRRMGVWSAPLSEPETGRTV